MIERIKRALEAEQIGTWSIRQTDTESVELFFVRKNLDLKRRTTLTDWSVSVYRTITAGEERRLGACSVPLYADMSEDALRKALRDAYRAAAFAPNPYYELIAGKREAHVPSCSALSKMRCEEAARVMGEALFSPDTQSDVFINSAELFAIRRTKRIVNARGVDVSWDACEVNGEYVIQCVSGQDVETYHSFSFREPDTEQLRADVAAALEQTRDRAGATQPPRAGTYRVLLTDESVEALLSYYKARSSAGMIYQHFSDFKVGAPVQGEALRGDKLTIELVADEPYDEEGIRLADRTLMHRGVLKTVHGGARFSAYLGIEPTGTYRAIRVPTGDTPFEALRREPYLWVVTFSDFQMDPMSGNFAGEIRLAYRFDGQKVTKVTGGSINGNLIEAQQELTFSKERYRNARYEGPLAVSIPNVAVAGC